MTRILLALAGLVGIVLAFEGVSNLYDASNQPPDVPALGANVLAWAGLVKLFFGSLLLAMTLGLDELIRIARRAEGHLSRMAPPEPEAPRATSVWSFRKMEGE